MSAARSDGERTRGARIRGATLTALAALGAGLLVALIGFSRGRSAAAERRSREVAIAEVARLADEVGAAAGKGGVKAALARIDAMRPALRDSDRLELLQLRPSARRAFLRRYDLLPAGEARKEAHDIAERARAAGRPVAEWTEQGVVRAVALTGEHSDLAVVWERLPARGPAAPPGGLLVALALGALALAAAAGLGLSRGAALGVAGAGAAAAVALIARAGARAIGAPEAESARIFGALGTLVALAVGVLAARGSFARAAAALRAHRVAYVYLMPAALATLLLAFVPFAVGLALGFFDHAHGTYQFVGIDNFVEILSGGGHPFGDPLNFWFTLGVTLLWTFVNVLLHVGLGLGLALLLSRPRLPLRGVYRVLLVLPWAVPNYITALIWRGMFQQHHGAVNALLGALGLSKVAWFSSFSAAFTANVVTNTWLGFPFMMVVALGALAAIPRELHEAAAVDGASRFTTFSRITLPLLAPALMPAVILGSIWTFNMFNVIYLVSEGRPGGATDILVTEAYRWAFERGDRYGLAAAYATLIFIVLGGYTLLANRGSRKREAMSQR